MLLTKYNLEKELFENILAPSLEKDYSMSVLSIHNKNLHSNNSNNITTIVFEMLITRHLLDETHTFLDEIGFKNIQNNLTSILKKYETLQHGLNKLNLQKESTHNYALQNLFKRLDITNKSDDYFNKLIGYLYKLGVEKVSAIGESLHNTHLLNANKSQYFFACLDHYPHSDVLMRVFQNFTQYENQSLYLLNEHTFPLFNSAALHAPSTSELLFLLHSQGIYRPGDKENKNSHDYKKELIHLLHQSIENIDHILSECKKSIARREPLDESIFRRIIINSHQQKINPQKFSFFYIRRPQHQPDNEPTKRAVLGL